MTVEEAWQQVVQFLPAEAAPAGVDTNDLTAAMKRTPSQVVFVTGHEELQRILADPFAAWRIFLHPVQRKIAYAPRYAGPVQVTGGAGTGKTVTALHRTAFLAEQASTRLFSVQTSESPPILLTTFTRNLAGSLAAQFASLVDNEEVRAQVEILNVDSLANHIVTRARGTRPVPAEEHTLHELWAATDTQRFSRSFLTREWQQVILAQDLHTEQEYLACSRAGQGTPLGKGQRSEVWRIIQQFVVELQKQSLWTYFQLANEAAHIVHQSLTTPYQHVIVDEAQDLHPAQWRLLRAVVAPGPDDLFIVGDPHQRIYDNHVSLASLGIAVRGRSRRLTMNYRTTQEILAWAVPLLGKAPVTGLDDEVDSLTGYRSPMHGRRPQVHATRTWDDELSALAAQLRSWLADGIEPHAIGIAARARYQVKEACTFLENDGIPAAALSAKGKRNAVRAGTMHAMKGLEFQAVAVIGVSAGTVPMPKALTPAADDPVAHALDLQRERCLLFVACTRARDHLYVSHHATPSPFLP
jgi:superfamily I DNA/RNA helicase